MRHIGAISGGKDSVAMAVLLKETHPDISFEWICTPTGNEPAAWFAHMAKLRDIIGPITPIMVHGGLEGLILRYNALPNYRQRWCTRQLKIEPFAAYLMRAPGSKFYVGLRADEPAREGGDYQKVPDVEMIFPLRDANMGLAEVLAFNATRGIAIPRRTDCKLCFFQRLIEWWELWRDDPDGWAEGERWEALTGHTFRSPQRDTWPASMIGLRKEFEAGRVPKETRRDPLSAAQCRVCRL